MRSVNSTNISLEVTGWLLEGKKKAPAGVLALVGGMVYTISSLRGTERMLVSSAPSPKRSTNLS